MDGGGEVLFHSFPARREKKGRGEGEQNNLACSSFLRLVPGERGRKKSDGEKKVTAYFISFLPPTPQSVSAVKEKGKEKKKEKKGGRKRPGRTVFSIFQSTLMLLYGSFPAE